MLSVLGPERRAMERQLEADAALQTALVAPELDGSVVEPRAADDVAGVTFRAGQPLVD
jgi:hypothetical protein